MFDNKIIIREGRGKGDVVRMMMVMMRIRIAL